MLSIFGGQTEAKQSATNLQSASQQSGGLDNPFLKNAEATALPFAQSYDLASAPTNAFLRNRDASAADLDALAPKAGAAGAEETHSFANVTIGDLVSRLKLR